MKKFLSGSIALFMIMNANAQEPMAIGFGNANAKDIALFLQQNNFSNTLKISCTWKFKKDPAFVGEKEQWYNGPGMHAEQLEMSDTKDFVTGMHVWHLPILKSGQGVIHFEV